MGSERLADIGDCVLEQKYIAFDQRSAYESARAKEPFFRGFSPVGSVGASDSRNSPHSRRSQRPVWLFSSRHI